MNKKLITYLFIVILLNTSCARNQNSKNNISVVNIDDSKEVKSTKTDKVSFKAKITRIIDGDTVEILYHQLTLKIRLAHIDTPEKRGSQPYGNAAKKVLSKLCFGKTITVVSEEGELDGYGRLIAELFIDDLNINKEMVRLGYAWHFKKYSDDKSYDELEEKARHKKIGLWQEKKPIAPWLWRKK